MVLKTLMEWNRAGFVVKKGSKSVGRNASGMCLFDHTQVTSREKGPKRAAADVVQQQARIYRPGERVVLIEIPNGSLHLEPELRPQGQFDLDTVQEFVDSFKKAIERALAREIAQVHRRAAIPMSPVPAGPTWPLREVGVPDAFGRSMWRDPSWGQIE